MILRDDRNDIAVLTLAHGKVHALDLDLLRALDARLATLFAVRDFSPRDWQPLPLLGIPGATAENERADYYDDTRQFRPPRTMRAGSSPGNR